MVFVQNERLWVRLHEKGGKLHTMPCQHNLEAYVKAYLDASGRAGQAKLPLFPTPGRSSKQLTAMPLSRRNALDMVKRRARQAGVKTAICNHSFRGTGITTYLENGGELEKDRRYAWACPTDHDRGAGAQAHRRIVALSEAWSCAGRRDHQGLIN